jgi:endonuclease-3
VPRLQPRTGPAAPTKRPFDIDLALDRIREAIRPFAKAAMFELAERGYGTLFHQLVGCIISIRTLDEVSLPTAIKLFEHAPTPRAIASPILAASAAPRCTEFQLSEGSGP